jgi:hypothetical protein
MQTLVAAFQGFQPNPKHGNTQHFILPRQHTESEKEACMVLHTMSCESLKANAGINDTSSKTIVWLSML